MDSQKAGLELIKLSSPIFTKKIDQVICVQRKYLFTCWIVSLVELPSFEKKTLAFVKVNEEEALSVGLEDV